jgi:hypothetical protein
MEIRRLHPSVLVSLLLRRLAGPLALAMALIGCSQGDPEAGPASPAVPVVAARPVREPTDEEAQAFAEALVDAVDSGEAETVNALIDWQRVLDTALQGIETSASQRREVENGVLQSVRAENGLAARLIHQVDTGGTFDFLRLRNRDGRKSALFRELEAEGGVGYYDFILEGRDGGAKAVDIYSYATADSMSQTMRRMLLPVLSEASRSLVSKLLFQEQDFIRDLPTIERLNTFARQGKFREAQTAYESLSESTRKDRTTMQLWLQVASGLGEKEYLAALEDYRRLFPDDPSLNFHLIDYYTLKNDIPGALESIDRLDKSVGGDPYLDVVRASTFIPSKRWDDVRRYARKAIEESPALLKAYSPLLTASLEEKKSSETLAILETLDEQFGVRFPDLKEDPDFADFVKTSEYQEWLAHMARREAEVRASEPPPPSEPEAARPDAAPPRPETPEATPDSKPDQPDP